MNEPMYKRKIEITMHYDCVVGAYHVRGSGSSVRHTRYGQSMWNGVVQRGRAVNRDDLREPSVPDALRSSGGD